MDILLTLYVEAYKRGMYDIIPIGKSHEGVMYYLIDKQLNALKYLKDDHTLFVGYGGSARSGKTALECFWVLMECLAYPGVGYGVARKELTVLKKTVLKTLFTLMAFYNLREDIDYRYFDQKNAIKFKNGSEIFFIDTAYQPRDPLYTRFGGFELTCCTTDESNETDYDAIGTLFGRCGWRKNEEYGIKKKMLETFNPDKGHIYSRYYVPYRDNEETYEKRFVPALPGDNPHPAAKEWIEDVIKEGDKVRIERLVNGNFDYDDNPDLLTTYDKIEQCFGNDHIKEGRKRISADLAMQGRDRFIAVYWKGGIAQVRIDQPKSTGRSIEKDLKALMRQTGVSNNNVISDADGLGNYLESYIRGIKEFRGNSRAKNSKKFANIKSECAWKLAEMINNNEIKIICSAKQEKAIKEELSACLRRDNTEMDTQKRRLTSKGDHKKLLGRSPDYFDVLLMGMVFYVKATGIGIKVKSN